MRKLLLVLALVAVVLGSLGGGGAASAKAAAVVSPPGGSVYRPGDTITFAVDGYSTWSVYGACGFDDYTADSDSPQLLAQNTSGYPVSCVADFSDENYDQIATVRYTVLAAQTVANELRLPSANPSVLYPRVRDGYRDTVTVGVGARRSVQLRMTVRNASGAVVRDRIVQHGDSTDPSYYRHRLTWDGRNGSGSTVAVGRYRITITSSALGYRTARVTVPVEVATGWKRVTASRSVDDAWSAASDKIRGNCYTAEAYPGERLDCWGGRYAQATYRFTVPADARITGWWVNGYRGCCNNGRVIKSGTRVSATRYVVRVRVTNWASYTVTGVGIRYSYRARI